MSVTTGIREASPNEVKTWMESGLAVLVDVRDVDERARERIEPSVSMPASGFDPARLPRAERIVFHCASGPRSREAAARAASAGTGEAYVLTGGIQGWKAAGLPTKQMAGLPISILRQMQLTVGTVVLVCSVLAVTVSAWFALGAAFMGAGLLFAGASGTCGMAAMLRVMPWNAGFRGAARS